MKTTLIAVAAGLISGAVSGWFCYGVGWSHGNLEGHLIGVLNCETREMCDRFLPAAKAWKAELERQ